MQVVKGISMKHYIQDRSLLAIEQFTVYEGQRIGLIGENGCGKTTLLRLIAQDLTPDEGHISVFTSLAYLPQFKVLNAEKSGGEITQMAIQQVLNAYPGLLLLDEPTTHLDQEHIQWLTEQLQASHATQVIVSHDRAFLNAVCTDIWEIKQGQLSVYKGNYEAYKRQKAVEKATVEMSYDNYKREKQQLEEAIRKKEEKAQRATKKPKQLSGSEARAKGVKPYYANKQKKLRKTASALESRLQQLALVQKPVQEQEIRMHITNYEAIKRRVVVSVRDLSGTADGHTLWKPVSFFIKSGEKIAILGKNGAGKTTLLKKLIEEVPGVTISPAMKIGFFSQQLSILQEEQSIIENVRMTTTQDETTIRIVLARMHFVRDDVYKKVSVLSGGEKVKVALAKLFLSEANMLVLDEPTNYLDIMALEALEELLIAYKGTVIFATHDRMFVRNLATRIFTLQDQRLSVFEGTLEAYEAHQSRGNQHEAEAKRLLLETQMTDVLSRLSIAPSQSLEEEYQQLVREKRQLDR